jgi:tungstate transport system permease protein
MEFLWDGLKQAISLLAHGDHYVVQVTWVTIKVAVISTLAALVLGLPLGLALGLGRFRGRNVGMAVANAGLGLPPVIVGLTLTLLMFPQGPFYDLHLLYTLKGVYVAQTVLALPIVIALSATAIQNVPSGLLDQARAFGATRLHLSALALREARVGVFAAGIAAVGSALSEVGAVVLVGGNIDGSTQTLASASLVELAGGRYASAMAIGIVLLGLILIVGAALTFLQQPGTRVRLRATA